VTKTMCAAAANAGFDDPEHLADVLLAKYGEPQTEPWRRKMQARWFAICKAGEDNEGIEMLKRGCG
jgi:hypothetical protein